jgi:translation elongation factor EF-Tu-like GTPase
LLAEEIVKGLAESVRFKSLGEVVYLLESFVDDMWMPKVVVCKEVELIEEVSDIDAGQRIHLREGQNTWETIVVSK